MNFAGLQATNASHTGTSAGSGYAARLTRSSVSSAWTATLVKHNGVGTAPVVLQTVNAAIPANATSAAISVNVLGSQVSAVVSAGTGSVTNLSATDTAHRGNFVGAEVFAVSGNGPLMTVSNGLDVLQPAVIPGPTPGSAPVIPEVTYPTNNSMLFGSSQITYWWGDGVTQWWL